MGSRRIKDSRVLFLHIPRTGGTWINHAYDILFQDEETDSWGRNAKLPWLFGPQAHRPFHLSMRPLMAEVDFLYTFVRHPLDLYVSWWRTLHTVWEEHREDPRYRIPIGTRGWNPWREAIRNWAPDFKMFVHNMVVNQPGFFSRMFDHFVGPDGGEICAFVGKTETLVEDFIRVMRILDYGDRIDRNIDEIMALGKVNNRKAKPSGVVEWSDKARVDATQSEKLGIARFYGKRRIHKRKYAELSGTIDKTCIESTRSSFWSLGKAPFDVDKENPGFWGK